MDRAYSHFLSIYRGRPALARDAFWRAVETELDKPYQPYDIGTHFLRLGLYHEQLGRYAHARGEGRRHDSGIAIPAMVLAQVVPFFVLAASSDASTDDAA